MKNKIVGHWIYKPDRKPELGDYIFYFFWTIVFILAISIDAEKILQFLHF